MRYILVLTIMFLSTAWARRSQADCPSNSTFGNCPHGQETDCPCCIDNDTKLPRVEFYCNGPPPL
ncbi:hypothetical protein PGT21_032450 [Puccinia graminis f. sp. tritici]|uniref:Secreted protein n=1 Tax=Puccinia graminis f. sp. tritici TaxID=56615 RepID=A0A5B0QYI2_PUCGR|nr:hypothetical protein PGT21_032450 [Puccinia graminis f. sp. tritici]